MIYSRHKHGVIAFCGSKGSGKSTSATIFKELYTGPTEELAFAGHLKKVCANVFLIDHNKFIDPLLKEVELNEYISLNPQNIKDVLSLFKIETYDFDKHVRPHIGQVFDTPRKLLQYVGTELLHPLDPLIHVNVTLKLKDPNKLSIITDLRFPKEFDYLCQRLDFIPVYVYNRSAEDRAAADNHPSERGVLTFKHKCVIVDNNGTMDQLRQELLKFMDNYELKDKS